MFRVSKMELSSRFLLRRGISKRRRVFLEDALEGESSLAAYWILFYPGVVWNYLAYLGDLTLIRKVDSLLSSVEAEFFYFSRLELPFLVVDIDITKNLYNKTQPLTNTCQSLPKVPKMKDPSLVSHHSIPVYHPKVSYWLFLTCLHLQLTKKVKYLLERLGLSIPGLVGLRGENKPFETLMF